MNRYEFELGVYIDADSEQEAHDKLIPVMDMLRELDSEGDPAIDGPFLEEA